MQTGKNPYALGRSAVIPTHIILRDRQDQSVRRIYYSFTTFKLIFMIVHLPLRMNEEKKLPLLPSLTSNTAAEVARFVKRSESLLFLKKRDF